MNLRTNEFPTALDLETNDRERTLVTELSSSPCVDVLYTALHQLPPLRTGSRNEGIKGEVATVLTSLRRFSFSELEGTYHVSLPLNLL